MSENSVVFFGISFGCALAMISSYTDWFSIPLPFPMEFPVDFMLSITLLCMVIKMIF